MTLRKTPHYAESYKLCCQIEDDMLSLSTTAADWKKTQKNGLPQCSVLFSIYTTDQSLHDGTRNFIYADDLCVTAKYPSFTEVEHTIEEALDELITYYSSNSLSANPDKTQVTSFHMKNREANMMLKSNGTNPENLLHLKYLGVTLDKIMSYKVHIHNTKTKVATQSNLLKKVSNSKWVVRQSPLEQHPVWTRSPHASKLDPELNDACRSITRCLRPAIVEERYLIVRMAPPDIIRDACA